MKKRRTIRLVESQLFDRNGGAGEGVLGACACHRVHLNGNLRPQFSPPKAGGAFCPRLSALSCLTADWDEARRPRNFWNEFQGSPLAGRAVGDRGRPTRHERPRFRRHTRAWRDCKPPPHLQIPVDVAGDRGALMTVWINVDTSKEVGDADHLRGGGADAWFRDNDQEGVAFAYPIIRYVPTASGITERSKSRALTLPISNAAISPPTRPVGRIFPIAGSR